MFEGLYETDKNFDPSHKKNSNSMSNSLGKKFLITTPRAHMRRTSQLGAGHGILSDSSTNPKPTPDVDGTTPRQADTLGQEKKTKTFGIKNIPNITINNYNISNTNFKKNYSTKQSNILSNRTSNTSRNNFGGPQKKTESMNKTQNAFIRKKTSSLTKDPTKSRTENDQDLPRANFVRSLISKSGVLDGSGMGFMTEAGGYMNFDSHRDMRGNFGYAGGGRERGYDVLGGLRKNIFVGRIGGGFDLPLALDSVIYGDVEGLGSEGRGKGGARLEPEGEESREPRERSDSSGESIDCEGEDRIAVKVLMAVPARKDDKRRSTGWENNGMDMGEIRKLQQKYGADICDSESKSKRSDESSQRSSQSTISDSKQPIKIAPPDLGGNDPSPKVFNQATPQIVVSLQIPMSAPTTLSKHSAEDKEKTIENTDANTEGDISNDKKKSKEAKANELEKKITTQEKLAMYHSPRPEEVPKTEKKGSSKGKNSKKSKSSKERDATATQRSCSIGNNLIDRGETATEPLNDQNDPFTQQEPKRRQYESNELKKKVVADLS